MSATADRPSSATQQISYTDLYARWERGNWSATELDFCDGPRAVARARSPICERAAALWNYACSSTARTRSPTTSSPFIDAAPREEQKYFLTTQQVDEARHSVFFHRFMHEVVEAGDGTIASALEATRPQLTWGFVKTFEMLDRVTGELRRTARAPRWRAP